MPFARNFLTADCRGYGALLSCGAGLLGEIGYVFERFGGFGVCFVRPSLRIKPRLKFSIVITAKMLRRTREGSPIAARIGGTFANNYISFLAYV